MALRQDLLAKRQTQGTPSRAAEHLRPSGALGTGHGACFLLPRMAGTEENGGHDSDHRFRLLVESVKDYAIFMLDPEGNVTSWNLGAQRTKGYEAAEIIGKHFSTFYPPEDIAAGKCERELALASREGRYEEEGWRLRKDGSRFWAHVIITALHSEEGHLLGFAKVTQDLTARLHAERERAIGREREAASRRKDDFLAVMSHELRNPLASIVATVDAVRLRGGHANETEMGTIGRQARHMKRLIDDLLDASRALRDNMPLLPVTIEIGQILADAIEVTGPAMRDCGHTLTVDIAGVGLPVNVDVERMVQVFGNILSNAAKYTSQNGRVHVRASATADQVTVSVEDSGDGIAPELLDQIFEPFVQGDQGLDRKRGGLGIGLAVVRKLVRSHDGEVFAESPGPGRGSRLTVRLPLAAPAFVSDESMLSPAKERRRILLIDDNHDFVESLQSALDALGHKTLATFDGPTGIAAALTFKPDIVFLDIGLPDLSGYEVVSQLRRVAGCEDIPIIAITGYAREADCALALRAGFTGHLAKPVDFARLEMTMSSCSPTASERARQRGPNGQLSFE